ncbi:MAG: L-2-amino-thiazoline-4-carboxylic acid hydrolase [Promethearchaeota archaeon]
MQKNDLWKEIPPIKNDKDRDSRKQISDAIILYRILQRYYPRERSMNIIHEVIKNAALAFLHELIPNLPASKLKKMNINEKENYITDLMNKFPNSDFIIARKSNKEFVVEITRCRFPELLELTGHPEIAPAFCAADILYFDLYQPAIQLKRTSTIAEGNEKCTFILSLDDEINENEASTR